MRRRVQLGCVPLFILILPMASGLVAADMVSLAVDPSSFAIVPQPDDTFLWSCDLVVRDGWSGGVSTGIDVVLQQGGRGTLRPDLMRKTGSQWASETAGHFAWESFPDATTCTVMPGLPDCVRFTMLDGTGAGVALALGDVVARAYSEWTPWDGASPPPNRQILLRHAPVCGTVSQILMPSGGVAIIESETLFPLSSPYPNLVLAVDGREVIDSVVDFGSVAATVPDRRPLSLGNFAWEYGDLPIGDIAIVGADAGAFGLSSPVGTTDVSIPELDYIPGLELAFNPDGTLAPGDYSATLEFFITGWSDSFHPVRYTLNGTVVPEPASSLLVVMGMGGLLFRSRRRVGHSVA